MAPTVGAAHSGTAKEWWEARRWPYNRALLIAGPIAFVCYVAAFQERCLDVPGAEITAVTSAFQAGLYLVAIGIANVCFNLGRWSEAIVKPSNPALYRRFTYRLGLFVSVALPFLQPFLIWANGCVGSQGAT